MNYPKIPPKPKLPLPSTIGARKNQKPLVAEAIDLPSSDNDESLFTDTSLELTTITASESTNQPSTNSNTSAELTTTTASESTNQPITNTSPELITTTASESTNQPITNTSPELITTTASESTNQPSTNTSPELTTTTGPESTNQSYSIVSLPDQEPATKIIETIHSPSVEPSVEGKERSSPALDLTATGMADDLNVSKEHVSLRSIKQESCDMIQVQCKDSSPLKPDDQIGMVGPVSRDPPQMAKKVNIRPSVPPPPPPRSSSLNLDSPPAPTNKALIESGHDDLAQEQSGLKLNGGKAESQESDGREDSLLESNEKEREEILEMGQSRKPPVYLKSFSVEQADLAYKGKRLDTSRPSSAEYEIRNCSAQERDPDKSRKGVFDRLRKKKGNSAVHDRTARWYDDMVIRPPIEKPEMDTNGNIPIVAGNISLSRYPEFEAGSGTDMNSTDEEPIYAQVYERFMPQANNRGMRYANEEWEEQLLTDQQLQEGERGRVSVVFDDFWSSDEFDSDSFSDEEDMERNETSLAKKQVTNNVKRQQIATELLTTERAYVQRLHLIDQVFHFKTVNLNRVQHIFPDDVIPQMFSNIKSIYQFHNDFLLPQLEQRMANWETTPKIGDLMCKFAPFLKIYSEYVKNFEHATRTIDKWKQRSSMFTDLIEDIQKTPECGGLSLQHHMLEPIQRVPRYELLLKDYMRYLEENSEDRPDTEKALERVSTAAAHSNQAVVKSSLHLAINDVKDTLQKCIQQDRFQKMLQLSEMFGGAVDLTDRPRELIKEGQIFKVSARNGTLFTRYLFLFTDMLLVCTDHSVHGRYHVHNALKVDSMQVQEGDNVETPLTFHVETNAKTVELHCRTEEETLQWFTTIQTVVGEYKDQHLVQQSIEKDKKLGHCAPRWVKDQDTSMCMACGSSFSIIKRRHHCRCCGIVVCGECSSHKMPLPYQNKKLGRVCNKCFEALKLQTDELQVKGSDPSVVCGMMLMSSDKKTWERRWFALHENFILYSFKAPQDIHALAATSIYGYTVTEVTEVDHPEKGGIIRIHNTDDTQIYYFQLNHDTIYNKWLKTLQCATIAEFPPDYVPKKKKSEDNGKINLHTEDNVNVESDC